MRIRAMSAALLVAALLVPSGATASAGPAASTFVRVDQVGYVAGGAKRAWLLSSADLSGSSFEVRTGGNATVFTGTVGADHGPWSAAFPHVYPMDFDSYASTGSFRIVASGATSPPFRIDATAATLYTPLVHNGDLYYRAQRDGANVDPTLLHRKPSHLNDAHAPVYATPRFNSNDEVVSALQRIGGPVNVEGGWFGAGDYLKFTGTTSFATSLMLLAARDHAAVADPARIPAEARHGVNWLLKMWNDKRKVLYFQVGLGEVNNTILGDHDIWRLPQRDDHYKGVAYRLIAHRPVLRSGPPGSRITPSLAGRLAAVFGLCAQVWDGTPYGNRCLREGQDVFALARAHHVGPEITAAPRDDYPEDTWTDDLEYGAIELYLGLREPGAPKPVVHGRLPRFYLRAASHWADVYMHSAKDTSDTFNLYDTSEMAHAELYRAIGNPGDGGLDVTQGQILADLRRQLDPEMQRASRAPFGFGGTRGDPSPHAFGLVIAGTEYDRITGTSRYAGMIHDELNWALGDNAWGTTFVVGAGTVFPVCMQDQVSNLSGSNTASPPLLLGASVDGPNSYIPTGFFDNAPKCHHWGFSHFDQPNWHYVDRLASWATVEPALDYTSLSLFAFVELAS